MVYVDSNVMNTYRVKFHDERKNILRLDMNENPEGLPAEFVSSLKEKITPEFIATYPEKDRITTLLAKHNKINPENISVTCGSDEAMRLIFQCFGEEGKELVTVLPTFEMYDVYANMFGMHHIFAEYNKDFTISIDTILNSINKNTGLVILLNPNSPIGTCWTETEVRHVIEKAADVGALVVVDEAYHYFCKNTFINLIKEYDNLLVLRTFSKVFSCAGLRIGYVSGNEELIHYIENAESTFNVNSVAILFAEELMKHPEMIDNLVNIEREGHDWLTHKLIDAGYSVYSNEGNYILFKPHKPSADVVSELKEKHNVWIRDYSRGVLEGWIRVSTGSKKCMEIFWDALSQIG